MGCTGALRSRGTRKSGTVPGTGSPPPCRSSAPGRSATRCVSCRGRPTWPTRRSWGSWPPPEPVAELPPEPSLETLRSRVSHADGVAVPRDRPLLWCITRLEPMPDRCEVLPGDSVVARSGGGLLWVDAPGSPALVAALHACLAVAGPGADRVLAAVASQVLTLGNGGASFALVLTDSSQGSGTGHATGTALWSGKGQPAVVGVPVSGSSVDGGCTLAAGFSLGQTL